MADHQRHPMDPEFERLLREEEEIERDTRPRVVSAPPPQVSPMGILRNQQEVKKFKLMQAVFTLSEGNILSPKQVVKLTKKIMES